MSNNTLNIIDIKNMNFFQGHRQIFNDFSLQIPRNKITAIMGPSGTGKTTLLKLIAGQLSPDSGSVSVNGQDVHKLSRKKLYAMRKKTGMLFQSGALLTDLNVYENVAFPLRKHSNLNEEMIEILVLMKLQSVGLRGAKHLMPSELSGGMSRRVALARATVLDPEIILYDEPFVGQDPVTMGVLITLIKKMNEGLQGLTSVIVSHDVNEVLSISDYVCIMSEGRVIVQGEKQDIINSNSEFVKQFIKGSIDGPMPYHYPAKDYKQDIINV